jgi:hypothetical protein
MVYGNSCNGETKKVGTLLMDGRVTRRINTLFVKLSAVRRRRGVLRWL